MVSEMFGPESKNNGFGVVKIMRFEFFSCPAGMDLRGHTVRGKITLLTCTGKASFLVLRL